MSHQTNTYEVGTILDVLGKKYSILAAFDAHPKLTVDEYRSLPENKRQQRINAFYDKLSAELVRNVRNLILTGYEDRRINTYGGCPVASYYRITTTSNYGTAWVTKAGEIEKGKEYYQAGEAITVHTNPDENEKEREFDGWYSNDIFKDSQKDWTFFVDQDMELEARYKGDAIITVESSNADLGHVMGGGTYPIGKTITIHAIFLTDVKFDGWYDENDSLISNMSSYEFKVKEDATYMAKFSGSFPPLGYLVTLEVDNPDKGSVSGGGFAEAGKLFECIAYPNDPQTFQGWYEGDKKVGSNVVYTFVPDRNITLTAKFDIPK